MERIRFEPVSRPRNTLVAVDASEQSFKAVRYVGRMLPAEGIRISLLHVLDPIPDCFWDLDSLLCFRTQVIGTDAWRARQGRLMLELIERARDLLVGLGHPKETIAVLVEEREQGIARDIARAAQGDFDTLVVGRKGMSKVQDLILGGVAHKLVSHLSQTTVWVGGG
jgi:nucleotide-binding universal stress UspA family protein